RRGGPGRHRGHPRRAVPGLPLLVRLPGLPEPGGPAAALRAARPVADRRLALGGVPAPPRAVHLRADRPPPGGEVLQGLTAARADARPIRPGRPPGDVRAHGTIPADAVHLGAPAGGPAGRTDFG